MNTGELAARFERIRLQHQVASVDGNGFLHCACGDQLGLRPEAPAQHLERLFAALALGVDDSDEGTIFIQWKGTSACVDLYCICGAQLHFDGYFLYAFECGACHRKWDMPSTPSLLPFSGQFSTVLIEEDES